MPGGFLFVDIVTRGPEALGEIIIAALERRQDLIRRHLVALIFAQRHSVNQTAGQARADHPGHHRTARQLEKSPSI